MDSLTQIVLGAAVGEATLGKRVGNKALFYGAVAGTIPDLDVIVGSFTDTITAIEWHRGFSHSILFCVLLAPILGWLVNYIEGKSNVGWKAWTRLFFWCLLTHPLLDLFTTWGTQLFWPLDYRFAFNSIFVIDPLYTVPFLITTIWLMFYKKGSRKRWILNTTGILISTAYLMSTLIIKNVVTNKFESALDKQGINYTKISTRPSPLNTVLWNANIDTKNRYYVGDYSFFDKNDTIRFIPYPKKRAASTHLLKYEGIQRLIKISNGWYVLQKRKGHWYFNDFRFGLIPQEDGTEDFVFSYKIMEEGADISAFEVPKTNRDAKYLLETLWLRITGI